ncbi:MAG TPA: pitrilysin family protein [Longimicrobium sp.]|nr:pitrilysin family protein [Longimicrobium sp.]
MKIPIERFALDNGLRVVFSEDHSNAVVAVNVWYDVGSRNEQPGRTGLAHLFEHMMFQGSENVADTQHVAHVERAGGSVNGSTWLDRTNYYETLPSHQLELALWLESDRMGFLIPALTQAKLDTQREVVKNERRERIDNAPYGGWDERVQAMIFPADHPYHHSVIGSMEDLDAASLDDVKDFFRTFYAPNNAVLCIAGDFDPAEARRLVERYFGEIPRGPDVPPLPGRSIPDPFLMGGQVRETVRGSFGLARVYVCHRVPPFGSDEYYAMDLLTEVLSAGKSSRMYRDLVRDRRLARAAGAFVLPVVTGAAAMIVRATVPPGGDVEALESAVVEHLDAIAAEAPSAAEMERAHLGLESRDLMELQRVAERADRLGMLTAHFDEPERINTELDRYRAVTAEEVRAAAERYLTADNRAVLTYLPLAAGEVAA